MHEELWNVEIAKRVRKTAKALPKTALTSFTLLLFELRTLGPYRTPWPNYSKLRDGMENYHCHIEKGRPTYVVCWRIVNKKNKTIEVYYAGTHERAPY